MKSLTLIAAAALLAGCGGDDDDGPSQAQLEAEGRQIFRYDTFGDEAKWTDTLRLHEVIAAAVDPATALSVGLKVDADALPQAVKDGIANGTVDLHSPATTIALLKLDAVVGLKGTVETVGGVDRLTRVGTTCALCHSTVDDSFAPGIGSRLDGWANRDLNPGAIIALSPAVDAAAKAVYNSWGAGKYDPRFNIDGLNQPVVIPPAFGLAGIHRITFTGDGDEVAYWNRYVAVTQMGGLGSFSDPRLPLSVTNGTEDRVSGKLVFEGPGQCATCHSGSAFTDANTRLHPPADSVVEPQTPSYAARSATKMYRTTPLRGVWQHPPYFHDGSAATLEDVAARYNSERSLGLSAQQLNDLAAYLKSL
jgi:mono/diheme cytochrome c family protein/cytochrome c5